MNAMLDGYSQETEQNRIKSLEPQQSIKYQFEISFFESNDR